MSVVFRRFRYVVLLLASLLVASCMRTEAIITPATDTFFDAAKAADQILATSVLSPTTLGSYISPVKGPLFQAVVPVDSRNAIVYVYRPHTRWGAEEIQAPSFYIDGMRVYGLKDNGYFWLELKPGRYQFMARRPLALFHLSVIFDFPFTVEGGKNYFFRYDETSQIKKPGSYGDLVEEGPLLQMPEELAMQEVKYTQIEDPGRTIGAAPIRSWSAFDLYTTPEVVTPARLFRGTAPSGGQLSLAQEGSNVSTAAVPLPASAAQDADRGWWQKSSDWVKNLFH